MSGRISDRWFGALAIGVFGALVWEERRRTLREPVEDKEQRVARNLAVAGMAAAAINAAETPIVTPLAKWIESRRSGLLYRVQDRLGFSDVLRDILAVVLLDYTLYLWHVVEHKVPALYRFHAVHHADLDLDTSTALRFHFGELVASVPWRAGQMIVIGVSPRALRTWQRLTMLSIMFHHSNVRLPIGVERWLSRLIMTPRLHGIHHSIVQDEQDSNWSSGLSLWDFLHDTYRGDVAQHEVEIGVAAYREPEQVTLRKIVALPFQHQPPLNRLPDGELPAEHAPATALGVLAQ